MKIGIHKRTKDSSEEREEKEKTLMQQLPQLPQIPIDDSTSEDEEMMPNDCIIEIPEEDWDGIHP